MLSLIHQHFVDRCLSPRNIQWPIKKCKTLGQFCESLYHLCNTQGSIMHRHSEYSKRKLYDAYLGTAALCAYLHTYHEFVDLLMVLAHTSTPGVAQGSELSLLWSVNSLNRPQNVYFLSGTCAIICNYLKTWSITGRDGYVAHFLLKPVSNLFIYLIGPLWEVVIAFTHQLFPDSIQVYKDYLYVVNRKTVNSGSFSAVLCTDTQHLNIPLTLTLFHQALKVILHAILHYCEDDDNSDDPMDASFSHSTVTANSWYGLMYQVPGLIENVYASAMNLTFCYHSWLGIGWFSCPLDTNNNSTQSSPSESFLQNDYLFSCFKCLLPLLEGSIDQCVTNNATKDETMDHYLPLIQDTNGYPLLISQGSLVGPCRSTTSLYSSRYHPHSWILSWIPPIFI